MSQIPGLNPAGALYIGNNSSLSIGNDSKLTINNGKVCINRVEIIPVFSIFDRKEYVYLVTDTIVSVTPNTVVTVSNDIFTLVEGGTYEFVMSKNLGVSLETVNANEIFDNNIGNFTSVIGYSLPQSTSSRFFIYAKLNSAVKLKIDKILHPTLTIKIKRVGPLNATETTPHNIPLILKSATNAMIQTIKNANYNFFTNYVESSLEQLSFLSNVALSNIYNNTFINKIATSVVKNKKITADVKWDMLRTYILQKVSPEIGNSIALIESECQSWTLSLGDVYNNIPINLRAINASQEDLALKKIVILQHAFEFSSLNIMERGLITSIVIEAPEFATLTPSIIDVTTSTRLPNLMTAVNPIVPYNDEMVRIYTNSAKQLLTNNDTSKLIKILQDSCITCLDGSIATFIKLFNTAYEKMAVVPNLNLQPPLKILGGDTTHPFLEVAELILSSPDTEIKLTGVKRVIGTFPFINHTAKITHDQLYGTYLSDNLIPYQCSNTMTISTEDIISTSISNGLTRYVIQNATPSSITGSTPYWKAPGTLLPNIPVRRPPATRLCFIRILDSQGSYSIYSLDIGGTSTNPTLVLQQRNIQEAISSIAQPYVEVHRKFLALIGMAPKLYGTVPIFDYLNDMNTSTLVKILTTVLCVSSSPEIIPLDESIFDNIPALYGIIKNAALQSTIWQSFIDFTQSLQTINYYAKLIINVKKLANDIQFTPIFTEKLLEVEPYTDITPIDNFESELLNDTPRLIGILLSNSTLDYILSKWEEYYASFLTNNDEDNTDENFYIQLLVNALRDCYTNWGNNLLNSIQNPLGRFLKVPYPSFRIRKLTDGKLYLQYQAEVLTIIEDLEYCRLLLSKINAIPGLNQEYKTVIENTSAHVTTQFDYIKPNINDMRRRSGIFRSTEQVLLSAIISSEKIISMVPSNELLDLLNLDMPFGPYIKNPFNKILMQYSNILNMSGIINRIESSFYTIGQLSDDTRLEPISSPPPTVLNYFQRIEPVLENLIKTIQKVVDTRGGSPFI
jgi:hypothetical protein